MGFEQALGGLLTGGVEGYRTGIKMQQEADKQKRDQELHESTLKNQEQQRKATGLQIDKGTIELKRAKDEEGMRAQIAKDTQALMNASMGGVSGDVMDNLGRPVATKTLFGDDATIKKQMQEQGIEFVPGSIKKLGPMDEFTKHRAMTDIMTKARFDHGLMDENSLKMVFENNKTLKNEGIEEGTRQFLLNGDSDAALQMFNKSGAIKSEKGMFLRRVQDEKTGIPDVAVYKPGKDGHPELVTTMNQYLTMTTSAGLQNYMATNLEKYRQTEANTRNTETVKGGIEQSLITAKAHVEGSKHAAGTERKDPVKERIDHLVGDQTKALFGNQSYKYNPTQAQKYSTLVTATAYDIMVKGYKGERVTDEAKAVGLAQKIHANEAPDKKLQD